MNKTIAEIIFEELPGKDGNLGLITLNRQNVLNALNHDMFIALDEQLKDWEKNQNIKAVVIRAAEGRAFCAGGDIRAAYEKRFSNDPTLTNFFHDEYKMNSRIHHFPKPYIALLDGITMGGGVGISIHGSHRVATERLIFALPETGIGFYPDVGTTYCLARFPHKIGYYLGLTGMKISYADCFAVGIVQEVVARESLSKIVTALAEASLPNKETVTKILKSFNVTASHSELIEHKAEIESCFSKNTVEEILHALENHPSEWCHKTAAIIKTKSPTSLKVTLRAIQQAEKLNFDESMKIEYRLTCHFLQGHDFFEGIRAVIIDKDQKPQWKPAKIEDVTEPDVTNYFSPLTKELA